MNSFLKYEKKIKKYSFHLDNVITYLLIKYNTSYILNNLLDTVGNYNTETIQINRKTVFKNWNTNTSCNRVCTVISAKSRMTGRGRVYGGQTNSVDFLLSYFNLFSVTDKKKKNNKQIISGFSFRSGDGGLWIGNCVRDEFNKIVKNFKSTRILSSVGCEQPETCGSVRSRPVDAEPCMYIGIYTYICRYK